MGKRNPSNNSVLQALLDAADCGYGGMTVDQLITKVSADSKLRSSLQAKWDAHAYPEHSMAWVQLAKAQHIMCLSDTAIKVLTCMGMYAHQSTLIQVSYKDLATVTGVRMTALRAAIKELIDAGCIYIARSASQHKAPIYSVHPGIMSKGVRRSSSQSAYLARMGSCQDYLYDRPLALVVQEQIICDNLPDGRVAYTRITLAPPEPRRQAPEAPRRREKGREDVPAQLPGQMSFDDLGWRANEA